VCNITIFIITILYGKQAYDVVYTKLKVAISLRVLIFQMSTFGLEWV